MRDNNLATVLAKQRIYDEAESLHRLALEKRKKVFGSEHSSTIDSMSNLAWTWKKQGQDVEAVELMRECVRLRTRVLGADHPDTIRSSRWLSKFETQAL